MIIYNKTMEKLVRQPKQAQNIDLEKICNEICSNLVCVNDCIISHVGTKEELDRINWSILLKTFHDYTGCEIYFNEIDIPIEVLTSEQIDSFILLFYDKIQQRFKVEDFCIIISCDEDNEYGRLRFHKYRKDEGLWLSISPLSCTQPIAYFLPDEVYASI